MEATNGIGQEWCDRNLVHRKVDGGRVDGVGHQETSDREWRQAFDGRTNKHAMGGGNRHLRNGPRVENRGDGRG
ncbi:hypothetical protein D3C83_263840 [compost metagenome]